MIDPHSYADTPEDVAADLEAERLETARQMLADARDPKKAAERLKAQHEKAKVPVMVSIAPGSGKVRKNGPCPCGSRKRFKNCCLEKVREGELEVVKHTKRPTRPASTLSKKALEQIKKDKKRRARRRKA